MDTTKNQRSLQEREEEEMSKPKVRYLGTHKIAVGKKIVGYGLVEINTETKALGDWVYVPREHEDKTKTIEYMVDNKMTFNLKKQVYQGRLIIRETGFFGDMGALKIDDEIELGGLCERMKKEQKKLHQQIKEKLSKTKEERNKKAEEKPKNVETQKAEPKAKESKGGKLELHFVPKVIKKVSKPVEEKEEEKQEQVKQPQEVVETKPEWEEVEKAEEVQSVETEEKTEIEKALEEVEDIREQTEQIKEGLAVKDKKEITGETEKQEEEKQEAKKQETEVFAAGNSLFDSLPSMTDEGVSAETEVVVPIEEQKPVEMIGSIAQEEQEQETQEQETQEQTNPVEEETKAEPVVVVQNNEPKEKPVKKYTPAAGNQVWSQLVIQEDGSRELVPSRPSVYNYLTQLEFSEQGLEKVMMLEEGRPIELNKEEFEAKMAEYGDDKRSIIQFQRVPVRFRSGEMNAADRLALVEKYVERELMPEEVVRVIADRVRAYGNNTPVNVLSQDSEEIILQRFEGETLRIMGGVPTSKAKARRSADTVQDEELDVIVSKVGAMWSFTVPMGSLEKLAKVAKFINAEKLHAGKVEEVKKKLKEIYFKHGVEQGFIEHGTY